MKDNFLKRTFDVCLDEENQKYFQQEKVYFIGIEGGEIQPGTYHQETISKRCLLTPKSYG